MAGPVSTPSAPPPVPSAAGPAEGRPEPPDAVEDLGPVRPSPGSLPRRLGQGFLVLIRTLRANILSFAGFVLVVVLSISAVVIRLDPGVLPYAPLALLTGPLSQGPTWAHPFGTDELGRDIFSNVAAALPVDLAIGVMISGSAMLFGGTLGVIAGYYNRPRSLSAVSSMVILRITDLFLAFPALILALAFVVALGFGLFQVVLAIFLTWWPYYVRLARGEVLTVKNQLYIQAARAAGVPERRIVVRHVLRNILEPLMVYFTLDIGTVIVTFSTVSFVTHALPYPSSNLIEWGSMIAFYEGGDFVTTLPWAIWFPGLAILITVLAFSLLGDGMRDILDPRSRRVIARVGAAAREGGGTAPAPSLEETGSSGAESGSAA